jgi:predicted Zn finger-like uncharacterized protein
MPFHTECPDCEAAYHLPDEQEGRRVRCKNCQAVFTAEPTEEAAEPRSRSSEEITSRPGPKKSAALTAGVSGGSSPAVADGKQVPLPWIVGGIVACVGLITVGAVAVAIILKPAAPRPAQNFAPASETAVATAAPPVTLPAPNIPPPPVEATPPPPSVAPAPAPTTPAPQPAKVAPTPANAEGGARITREATDKVKRATVYIHVTYPDNRQASGSGFFGAVENPNLILTNAHVVGMLAPESHKPKKVEIVINSGEANMKKTEARVLGVDRLSDLAVLDVGTPEGMPAPLKLKPASGLQILDPVYVFGFPFGKSLGEEITVRPTSVSALRKHNGELERVQVAGGMDPGNSGGPVVDSNGDVVGVAVSGIRGTLVNFAIPGERVSSILKGRLSTITVGLPYQESGRVSVPVQIEMIDPRNLIKSVSVDVWTGKSGTPVTTGDKLPPPRPGDSPHQRVEISYSSGIAKGSVPLPELPAGKVYWLQPTYIAGNDTFWVAATMHDFKPELALERKPANLRFRPAAVSRRQLEIVMKNTFRSSSHEDDENTYVISRNSLYVDRVASSDSENSTERLEYGRVKYERTKVKATEPASPVLALIEANLNHCVATLRVDNKGNPRDTDVPLDTKALLSGTFIASPGMLNNLETQGSRVTAIPAASQVGQKLAEEIVKFLEPGQQALALTAVPLPNEDNCAPEKTWSASQDRVLPIETPFGNEKGSVRLNYTYLGQRIRERKAEAVLAIEGAVTDKEGNEKLGGEVNGTATVDLTTGIATHVELKTLLDVEVINVQSGETRRALATIVIQLKRTL